MRKIPCGVAATAWLATLCLNIAPVYADTLAIPLGQQGKQSVDRPPRGTNMQQVEVVYGPPAEKSGPVGTPPISQWEYSDYTVYFEGDTVLHTVLKQKRNTD